MQFLDILFLHIVKNYTTFKHQFWKAVIKNIINWLDIFFFFNLGGVILYWNLITSKNQFTNQKSQRKVTPIGKNDAFRSCLGINYYTLRPQLGHVHTFDRNANIFVPCASFRYNFGELFFKIVTKEKPSFNVLFIPYFWFLVFWSL